MSAPRLESPLPAALAAGRATALFLSGSGAPRRRGLRILVDGVAHRAAASGMPRPDLGTRDGWWATVPVPAAADGAEVVLAATDGGTVAELARLPVRRREPTPARGGPPGLIAVCLATFDPDEALLRAQLDSLRAQTDERWVCVVSDDASSPEGFAILQAAIGDDPRFIVARSDRRRGFYRNFERALELVPPDAELVALCDQDDRWHPDKLATLRAELTVRPGAVLAFSDQRLTDAAGGLLRETLWTGRAVNADDLPTMLVANSITGAATLFRRELLDLLLPFPDTPGLQFHDHWLGMAALAAGEIAYVDRPLYDYVQHRGAVFGDVTGGDGRRRARRSRRAAYFCGYLAREVAAQALLARGGDRLRPGARRDLERFVAAQRSPRALAWLATRPRRDSTLGSEGELVQGVLWRWAAGAGLARDASFPDPLAFEQRALRRWRSQLATPSH
jgi:glycosyltransferase involved in cell wall biosynthesis